MYLAAIEYIDPLKRTYELFVYIAAVDQHLNPGVFPLARPPLIQKRHQMTNWVTLALGHDIGP